MLLKELVMISEAQNFEIKWVLHTLYSKAAGTDVISAADEKSALAALKAKLRKRSECKKFDLSRGEYKIIKK